MTRSEILKLAHNRMIKGSREHGKWNPLTDQRDLNEEMVNELLDIINYAIMQIQKLTKKK